MVVKVEVYNDGEQWCARGIGADLFTCARSLDESMVEVKDAAACHFLTSCRWARRSTC